MIAIIAAYDKNRTIGRGGHMPWRIPGEQRRFRELTTGAAVVMGRRTWQEIGRPLPNRLNIVLSRDPDFSAPGCATARSLAEAISLAIKDLDKNREQVLSMVKTLTDAYPLYPEI